MRTRGEPRSHLHLLSADFASECLKHKKHVNSFTTRFFVPPEAVARALENEGAALPPREHASYEALLKSDMRCPATGAALKNMPALKLHLASPAYADALACLPTSAGLLRTWPADLGYAGSK